MSTLSEKAKQIASNPTHGVSFSVQMCNEYGISWQDCLQALISVGVKRFRIMSYWDEYEPTQGNTDFSVLDQQLDIIEEAGATATLCIGMRQPRWPETHLPQWAIALDESAREEAYIIYHQQVIERYKPRASIESWQLENEFWNKGFGLNDNFSRPRLIREFKMLRDLDPEKPIIMSLGNTTGYPLGAPKPDLFGTTIYLIQYEKGKYSNTKYSSWYFAIRRSLMKIVGGRDLLIHELQAEPWGPQANYQMSDEEQAKSMNPAQLQKCVDFAKKTGMPYMDLWGGEWWYWRYKTRNDTELWSVVESIFVSS